MTRLFLAATLAAMIFSPLRASAQQNGGKTTSDGIYTREQAMRGQDVYAGNCRSCHTPESHTGPMFTTRWNGKSLLELYAYIRNQMPKNDPGTLTAEEYADIVAYMLRMNRLPLGESDLPADTMALKSIRVQVGKP